jgi:hypothetical protein
MYQCKVILRLKLRYLKYNMYFRTILSQIKVQGLVYYRYNV